MYFGVFFSLVAFSLLVIPRGPTGEGAEWRAVLDISAIPLTCLVWYRLPFGLKRVTSRVVARHDPEERRRPRRFPWFHRCLQIRGGGRQSAPLTAI